MRMSTGLFALLAVIAAAFFLQSAGHSATATQKPIFLCTSAKTGDAASTCAAKVSCGVPVKATDEVKTTLGNGGAQVWEPYSTLTSVSAVAPCTGGWSSLAVQGIPLFSALTPVVPVTPTTPAVPVTVTPVPKDYLVTVPGSPIAADFQGLDSTQPQCFTVTAGTQSAQVCLPASNH